MTLPPLPTDTAAEGARVGLLALMAGLSEEYWCAGWLTGLEYSLWRIEPGARFGMGRISPRQATLLTLLAEEAGGWWVWYREPVFLPMAEWLDHLEKTK
jgi:hypothetical protein